MKPAPTFALAALLVVAMLRASAALAAPPQPTTDSGSPQLHVPSPDWRDQVLYLLMIDRFDNGDPGNDDQRAGEYDPADPAKFSGGDLAGVTRRVEYLRELGATAVWITPPVANLWWDVNARYGGYHGYWASDFKSVDRHFGQLADYQRLSRALHGAGMYLVQDIVVNHTGNFFQYGNQWTADDPSRDFALSADSTGATAPTQWPFSLNDARDPAQRAAGIYHWTPRIRDFTRPEQELTFQLSELDDLNTENPLVRTALRDSYGYWIREAGVDGFRVDTAFYVPPAYFEDFLNARDPEAPGVARVAAATGRDDFLLFGEGFGVDKPYDDKYARKIESYATGAAGQPLLPGMIAFPLYATLGDVFARGHATAELGYRIDNAMAVHARPHLMPTFLDNHDVDRFLNGGSVAGLKQALLAMMTLPGIPTIYYGTEQQFTEPRAAMFAGGHGSGGVDHFNSDAPMFRYIQRATALRRENRLFSRGVPTVLATNAAAPGVLAYRMAHDGDAAIVVFNSSDREALLDNLETGTEPGTVLEGLFGIDAMPMQRVVGVGGTLSLVLPPRSGMVWKVGLHRADVSPSSGTVSLDPLPETPYSTDVTVHGTATGVAELDVVVDGDLAAARRVRPGPGGRWSATLDTGSMIDPAVRHRVVAWSSAASVASEAREFTVRRPWILLADVADAVGDDHGPAGRYQYPTDPAWRISRPADIEGVRVYAAGGALRVEVRMHELVAAWNPPHGFDHVAFNVFLQMPRVAGGITAMPLQNATLPDDMRWHYRLRANGWSHVLFSSTGASHSSEGTAVAEAPRISVDTASQTVTFTLPARASDDVSSWSGAKLYVNTWDADGGFRALGRDVAAQAFGGGDGAVDPLVMDDTVIITLP